MKRLIHSLLNRFTPAMHHAARKEPSAAVVDPLDPMAKPLRDGTNPWPNIDMAGKDLFQAMALATAAAFPMYDGDTGKGEDGRVTVGDAAIGKNGERVTVMDAACNDPSVAAGGFAGMGGAYAIPPVLQEWFLRQSFIGYQACAILAQHWLVDKACSMPAQDAIRNGWEVDAVKGELDEDQLDILKTADKLMGVKQHAMEFVRNTNVFGIRVVLFDIESNDPDYYEKPFNPDGITQGSYKGIRQIDPYWMMPQMTMEATGDPTNVHFYDPEYWIISGRRYHRSHLIIGRGPTPADILKPTYIFGGIPLTQRIYERVYAAERTANEAPLLAMNKRTTAIHVDLKAVAANEVGFVNRIKQWSLFRDNHSIKVLGKEETMDEFDTSLSDLDKVIMNQYQIVAAISRVPATKLLGTQPTGFNSTGDYEETSYHEELESIQEIFQAPLIDRHHMLVLLSNGIRDIETKVAFNPVDAMSAEKQATVNKAKADTDTAYLNAGAISSDEVRTKIRQDPRSGYTHLSDETAEEEFGMSTENLLEQQKIDAATEKAQAAQSTAVAKQTQAGVPGAPEATPPAKGEEHDSDLPSEHGQPKAMPGATVEPGINALAPGANKDALIVSALQKMLERLDDLHHSTIPEGRDIPPYNNPARQRTVEPGMSPSVMSTTLGTGAVVPQMPGHKLPKMRMHGLPLVIENPRNTIRQGQDMDGTAWSQKMPHHYGYINGVQGADGDDLDCFVGHNMAADKVFVVNQKCPISGEFDEHKCMLGFDDEMSAKQAYDDSFNADWAGFDSIVTMSLDQFRQWIGSGRVSTPLQASQIATQTTVAPNPAATPANMKGT
jgi:phage-related protein (TIGR01555 family)